MNVPAWVLVAAAVVYAGGVVGGVVRLGMRSRYDVGAGPDTVAIGTLDAVLWPVTLAARAGWTVLTVPYRLGEYLAEREAGGRVRPDLYYPITVAAAHGVIVGIFVHTWWAWPFIAASSWRLAVVYYRLGCREGQARDA